MMGRIGTTLPREMGETIDHGMEASRAFEHVESAHVDHFCQDFRSNNRARPKPIPGSAGFSLRTLARQQSPV